MYHKCNHSHPWVDITNLNLLFSIWNSTSHGNCKTRLRRTDITILGNWISTRTPAERRIELARTCHRTLRYRHWTITWIHACRKVFNPNAFTSSHIRRLFRKNSRTGLFLAYENEAIDSRIYSVEFFFGRICGGIQATVVSRSLECNQQRRFAVVWRCFWYSTETDTAQKHRIRI